MRARLSTALSAAAAALALACTTERAANLRHPVGGTTRMTSAVVAPEERYAGPPPGQTTRPVTIVGREQTCAEQFPAVEFAPSSSSLAPAEQAALERVAGCLRGASDGGHIVLVGHVDRSPSGAWNRSLGAERAAEVRDRLVSYGVPGDRIIVSAPEESARPASAPDVEIFVTKTPAKP